MSLSDYLSPIRKNIEDLLLDPNNPRFAELGEPFEPVPEARFAEDRVQRDSFEKMKIGNFDVAELRDTIKTIGFLQMDRMVVRKWRNSTSENTKYVVIEGNRRLAALKWLLELHGSARETFSPEQLNNFTELDVLLLNDELAPESAKWVLPGLRHVSGIKEWGAYQKARAVHRLRESGISSQEVAQSLGLSTRAANQLWRSFLALEQMRGDEEYGEYAEPKMYSYFEEVFKRANVRDWLQWGENERKFLNQSRLTELYSWIVGEINENGEPENPKLPEAKSIRQLGGIINDESALAVFRSPDGTLTRALARFEAEHPEEWKPIIDQAQLVLSRLTPDILRGLAEDDISSLNSLKDRINRLLQDRDRLLGK